MLLVRLLPARVVREPPPEQIRLPGNTAPSFNLFFEKTIYLGLKLLLRSEAVVITITHHNSGPPLVLIG